MGERVFSYGGGVQSTAALVLAAQGKIDFPTFVFANTGDNAENPDTLEYVRGEAADYARAKGVNLVELKREWKDGRDWSLYDLLMNPESKSIGIPVRMSNGAPGTRACTLYFKIRVIAKWLKGRGATEQDKSLVGLGISMDEFKRMRTDSGIPHYDICYPLIDLRLNRQDCMNLISAEGLPVPPKSSCFFCPYHTISAWKDLKRKKPDLFEKSVELERHLNDRRKNLGKDEIYLTSRLQPLDQVVQGTQNSLLSEEEEEACESGFCMV